MECKNMKWALAYVLYQILAIISESKIKFESVYSDRIKYVALILEFSIDSNRTLVRNYD